MSTNDMTIAEVALDTRIGKDTLRMWEKRYGFPVPGRDEHGERLYAPDQVVKLRLIKRLLNRGHRPGKIIGNSLEELQAMLQASLPGAEAVTTDRADCGELIGLLSLCQETRIDELRQHLMQSLLRLGLRRFVMEVAAPLVQLTGDYWAQGKIDIYAEHLCTEVLQELLRAGMAYMSKPATAQLRPRILLTTLPQEAHGMGLLMAQALFALEGASCMSLGLETPITEIVMAAKTVDIVALSFSISYNANRALNGIRDLAALLEPHVEIWVGGNCPGIAKWTSVNVTRLSLEDLGGYVQAWRDNRLGLARR